MEQMEQMEQLGQFKQILLEIGREHVELQKKWEKLKTDMNMNEDLCCVCDLDGDVGMTGHLCNHEMIEYIDEIRDMIKNGESLVV